MLRFYWTGSSSTTNRPVFKIHGREFKLPQFAAWANSLHCVSRIACFSERWHGSEQCFPFAAEAEHTPV